MRIITKSTLLRPFGNRFNSTTNWVPPVGYNTGIKVYNCVAKSTVPVILRNKSCATWYTCGPTVYDSSHIGHASSYVKLDIVQKILKNYFGINLITAMNITDIDDKIIKQCTAKRMWHDIAEENEQTFWTDLRKLGVTEPDIKLRVSENIPDIVAYIAKLMSKGAAYVGSDGSIYFRVNECKSYGKLQTVHMEADAKHSIKASPADFALWKLAKPNEPVWPSPWGAGRPGWHIECSTLASKIFGDGIDFHAGGLDLRFPHHENEEAQCCVYYDQPQWVNYWLHTGQLSLKGQQEKMSKSLKNTISIEEFLRRNDCETFRMACVLSNYRNAIAYSDETMLTAKRTLERLLSLLQDFDAYARGKRQPTEFDSSEILKILAETQDGIDAALRDDFDTSKAIGYLIRLASHTSKLINDANTMPEGIFSSNVGPIIAVDRFCRRILDTFGFSTERSSKHHLSVDDEDSTIFHNAVDNIVDLRNKLRVQAVTGSDKNLFRISDEIRQALKLSGVEVKDHGKGSSWHLQKKIV